MALTAMKISRRVLPMATSPKSPAFTQIRPRQTMSKQGVEDINAAAKEIKKTAEDLREKANLVAATAIGKTVNGGSEAVGVAKDIGGKAKQAAQNAWETTREAAQKAKETVVDKAMDAKEAIKDTAESASEAVKRTVNMKS